MFSGEFVEFGVEDVEEFVARWFRWSLARRPFGLEKFSMVVSGRDFEGDGRTGSEEGVVEDREADEVVLR